VQSNVKRVVFFIISISFFDATLMIMITYNRCCCTCSRSSFSRMFFPEVRLLCRTRVVTVFSEDDIRKICLKENNNYSVW
jgi:hypothetical protein